MSDAADAWQIERMELTEQVVRMRSIIDRYEEHLSVYRSRVEEARYQLGRLDERLEAQ